MLSSCSLNTFISLSTSTCLLRGYIKNETQLISHPWVKPFPDTSRFLDRRPNHSRRHCICLRPCLSRQPHLAPITRTCWDKPSCWTWVGPLHWTRNSSHFPIRLHLNSFPQGSLLDTAQVLLKSPPFITYAPTLTNYKINY